MQQNDWQRQAWQQPGQNPPNPQDSAQEPAFSAGPRQAPGQDARTSCAGAPSAGSAPASYAPGAGYAVPPQQAAAYAAAPPKRRGWIVALVAVVLMFVVLMFGMVSCTGALGALGASMGSTLEEDASVATSGPSVAVIELSGTIQYDGTSCSPEGLKDKLDQAEGNPDIKAVVLRVDSGGGTATAGEEMAQYLKEFSKPVVVSSASMNASAAYEISSQADYIYTAQSTAIGAIGTVMQFTDLSGLYEKLGIRMEDIASAESKDSSYGNRPLTDEERQYYQHMVDQINETFLQNVAEGRGMDIEQVRQLATGMTFTGIDAVENGLADEIGTLEDACAKAAELGEAGDAWDTVYLRDGSSTLESLLSMENSSDATDVLEALKELDADGNIAEH